MNKSVYRLAAGIAAASVLAGGLAACTTNAPEEAGPVTLTVGDLPPADSDAARALFEQQVKDFEAAYPDINLEPSETVYDPTTFQAMLAGGTLPDVINVSNTEGATIGSTGQVADLTEVLASSGLGDKLNPVVLDTARGADGQIYGVPTDGFAMGLVYNRAIFEQAGLDPDNPPTTWEEVREAAQTIKEKTGVDGFAHYGANNQGGWQLTTEIYSYGGRVTDDAGTKSELLDTSAAADMLQLLSDMRFKDGTIGENTVYSFDDAGKDFAAGKFAMMVIFSQAAWGALVQANGFPGDDLGIGALPQEGDTANGTLQGGAITVVNAKTTDAEKAAALKWIEWRYLKKYTDETAAIADAQATADSGAAVGIPTLPILNEAAQADYNDWIAPYVNVPVANFAGYVASASVLPVIPEPVKNGQAIFARLDTVVQAVLGDPNADIPALLKAADGDINQLLTR